MIVPSARGVGKLLTQHHLVGTHGRQQRHFGGAVVTAVMNDPLKVNEKTFLEANRWR